jgi:hypothetical protein
MTPNHNCPARLFGYRLAEVKRNSDRQPLAGQRPSSLNARGLIGDGRSSAQKRTMTWIP